ncbi:Ubiquitin thioesterase OTUB1 [Halotydeus destructor]|nr:Ubiquitin thioesterase OTUB1 [Halotydeus destructor]
MAINEAGTETNTGLVAPNPSDGWNPEFNQDEAIKSQEQAISDDIANRCLLVGEPETLDRLKEEFAQDDVVYRAKIDDLKTKFQYLRRTRPDGNCFFRAFGYAYFETLLNDELELNRFSAIIQQRKEELIGMGFPKFTTEDFYDNIVAVLVRIANKEVTTQEALLDTFNECDLSNYLIVFWRLITSGYLQKNEEFYSNFIEGHLSVKEFCQHEVEPMFKESDHIHIIALTTACDVSVCINYLDRSGTGDKVSIHTFPEGSEPRIHLLYRPGHYDILYPVQQVARSEEKTANQSAEISSSS